jgi:hypothetical protein
VAVWTLRASRAAEVPVAPQTAPDQRELEPIRVFTLSGEYASDLREI